MGMNIDDQKKRIADKLQKCTEELLSLYSGKDKEKVNQLVDKIISLKGQIDIEPTLFHIPLSNLIKQYDNGSIVIYKCKDCIIWRNKGGRMAVVYPGMKAEYDFLMAMLEMKDEYEKSNEDVKMAYDACYFGYSIINSLPSVAFVDDRHFVEAAEWVGNFSKTLYEELINRPLQDETPIQDAEHVAKMEIIENIGNHAGSIKHKSI